MSNQIEVGQIEEQENPEFETFEEFIVAFPDALPEGPEEEPEYNGEDEEPE